MFAEQPQTPADPAELIKKAAQALQDAVQAEGDDQDSQLLSQALQIVYRVLADRQKEAQDMVQGKLSPRAAARS